MTMSKVNEDEGRDKYEPIKRLAMVQIQPPRNPSKPLTSFCIKDILGTTQKNKESSPPKHHHFNFHFQFDEHSSPQQHKTNIPRDRYVSGSHNISDDLNCSTGHRKSSALGRDLQGDLLNMCRLDKIRDNIRSDLLLSPSLKSSNTNVCHKLNVTDFQSPCRNLALGELQVNPQTTPVNMCTKIVRPWVPDLDICSPSTNSSIGTNRNSAILTASEASSDDEEEISVDDDEPPARIVSSNGNNKVKSVSPLDALMAMTSKTFEGLEGGGHGDTRRRDQTTLFGKHQPPKKRRKSRTAFTNQQIYELEKRFLYQKYLTPADRDEIASTLGLTNAQVITWFQNRRAKLKRDLEELKNDVTAAKKLPAHKYAPESQAEIDLRKVQEKTLRDSFNNGGIHSPNSMTSLSDEALETSITPVLSPNQVDDDDEIPEGSDGKHEEPMDTKWCDAENDSSHDDESDHIRLSEKHHTKSCIPQDRVEFNLQTHSYYLNKGDQHRAPGVEDKKAKSELDGTT